MNLPPNGLPMRRRQVLRLATLVEGGLVVVGLGLIWLLDLPSVDWRAAPGAALLGVVATLPLLGLMWLLTRVGRGPVHRLTRWVEEMVGTLFAGSHVGELLWVSALAGVGEEAVFRGVIQAGLGPFLGRWTALAIASLAFGLAHAVSLTYAVFATLMGLYLGALMHFGDGLVAPMVAHGLYDFVALVYLLRRGGSGRHRPA